MKTKFKNDEIMNKHNNFITYNDSNDEHIITFIKTDDNMIVLQKVNDKTGIITMIDRDFNISTKCLDVNDVDEHGHPFSECLDATISFSDNFVIN